MVRDVATKRWRAIPSCLVTAVTIGIGSRERIVVAHMAVRALVDLARRSELVRTGQRPAGGGVIKGYVGPQSGIVAGRAVPDGEGGAC